MKLEEKLRQRIIDIFAEAPIGLTKHEGELLVVQKITEFIKEDRKNFLNENNISSEELIKKIEDE